MWKRSDVDPNKKYQVALCASPSGSRSHALHPRENGVPPENTLFLTEVVPTDLLLRRNFHAIAKAVRIVGGKQYCVDAHGIWLMMEEMSALEEELDVPWVTAVPPEFAPK